MACTCLAQAPSGWTGPVPVYEVLLPDAGSISADAGADVACPTGMAGRLVGETQLLSPPPSCTMCTCSSPSDSSCTVTASFSDGPTCTNASSCGTVDLTSTTMCTQMQPSAACSTSQSTVYVNVTVTPAGGKCVPDGGVPNGDDPGLVNPYYACDGNGNGTCAAGEACVPNLPSPFRTCIYQAASMAVSCPSPYTKWAVVTSPPTDSRTCSPCDCKPQPPSCVGGGASFTTNSHCSATPIPVPETCAAFTGVSANSPLYGELNPAPMVITAAGTTCPAVGGVAQGSVTTPGVTTICCL